MAADGGQSNNKEKPGVYFNMVALRDEVQDRSRNDHYEGNRHGDDRERRGMELSCLLQLALCKRPA